MHRDSSHWPFDRGFQPPVVSGQQDLRHVVDPSGVASVATIRRMASDHAV